MRSNLLPPFLQPAPERPGLTAKVGNPTAAVAAATTPVTAGPEENVTLSEASLNGGLKSVTNHYVPLQGHFHPSVSVVSRRVETHHATEASPPLLPPGSVGSYSPDGGGDKIIETRDETIVFANGGSIADHEGNLLLIYPNGKQIKMAGSIEPLSDGRLSIRQNLPTERIPERLKKSGKAPESVSLALEPDGMMSFSLREDSWVVTSRLSPKGELLQSTAIVDDGRQGKLIAASVSMENGQFFYSGLGLYVAPSVPMEWLIK